MSANEALQNPTWLVDKTECASVNLRFFRSFHEEENPIALVLDFATPLEVI